ncbi:MAG: hypothetical protein ABIR91_00205 [Candidatus Saccharimonadales bacterium]
MIYLIGQKVCPNCDSMRDYLLSLGVQSEKIILDYDNVEHSRMIDESRREGFLEAPMIVRIDDDVMYRVASGTSEFAKTAVRLAVRKYQLATISV